MKQDKTKQSIDGVMAYIASHSEQIAVAHDTLGVTLEELICGAVRRALSLRAVEAEGQLALFAPIEAKQIRLDGEMRGSERAQAEMFAAQEAERLEQAARGAGRRAGRRAA